VKLAAVFGVINHPLAATQATQLGCAKERREKFDKGSFNPVPRQLQRIPILTRLDPFAPSSSPQLADLQGLGHHRRGARRRSPRPCPRRLTPRGAQGGPTIEDGFGGEPHTASAPRRHARAVSGRVRAVLRGAEILTSPHARLEGLRETLVNANVEGRPIELLYVISPGGSHAEETAHGLTLESADGSGGWPRWARRCPA
jgi:hypothetical protein